MYCMYTLMGEDSSGYWFDVYIHVLCMYEYILLLGVILLYSMSTYTTTFFKRGEKTGISFSYVHIS